MGPQLYKAKDIELEVEINNHEQKFVEYTTIYYNSNNNKKDT